MKANKVTVEIKLECLSPDTVRGLLLEVSNEIRDQKVKGSYSHEDGDSVQWSVETTPVEF